MSPPPPPPAPESFARAYAALRGLVEGLWRGGAADRIRAWRNGPCGGSDSLAKAAALAMRHEIAAARLAEGATRSPADDPEYGALREVERALRPPEPEEIPPPVGVELPPELRRALGPGARGVRMGVLEAIFSRSPAYGAILSLSHPERLPRVEEMRAARLAFGRSGPRLYMELPVGDEATGPPYSVKLFLRPPEGG